MDVRWEAKLSLQEMVDEGVRRAYTDKDNPLRASVLADPDGTRKNTRDNTPAVIHMELVPGDKVEVNVAAKGGGSENKTQVRDAQSERLRRRLGALGRCRRWAPTGARPACSASASAARREGDAAGQVGH